MVREHHLFAGLLVLLGACSTESPSPPDAPPTGETPAPAPAPLDPFAPTADRSEGLTNVSADLRAILEDGALAGACDAWRSDPGDRRKKLLCGKAMFFYEGFDQPGVPTPIYDFMAEKFPSTIGTAYTGLGLIADPFSDRSYPLGAVPGGPTAGGTETVAFGCASCHFGRLPDGRYAVGAANHDYDYGAHLLHLMVLPAAAAPGFDEAEHHPDAIDVVRPSKNILDGDTFLRIELGLDLLPLLSESGAGITVEYEGLYASWKSGTMDFVMAPLPLDDDVHTISKIIDLWDLPTPNEVQAFGMTHELLAWSGGARSLVEFVEGAVAIGGGDDWSREQLSPLVEYVLSLRTPEPKVPVADDLARLGRERFEAAGCQDCHEGPRGAGLHWFDFEEIGTDDAMRYWADPDLTGTACCGLGGEGEGLTHGIKAPRLTGLWAKTRFLHNGSLDSLEELLCLEARPDVAEPAYGTQGHTFGCDLPEAERRSILDFLSSL